MVTKPDKSYVLSGLFAAWDDIDALLDGLPSTQWLAATPLPGWDLQAIVSHIVGTESFLEGIPAPEADVSGLEHVRNEIGAMNERWVRYFSGEPASGVLARFREVTGVRRRALTGMSDEDWDAVGPTPFGMDSYGRFMRIRTFDCWMHEQDIRMALQRPSSDDELAGPASQLSLDEVEATMGYVVGKLGKAPGFARVVRPDRPADP